MILKALIGKWLASKTLNIIREGLAKRGWLQKGDKIDNVLERVRNTAGLGTVTDDEVERFHHHDEPN